MSTSMSRAGLPEGPSSAFNRSQAVRAYAATMQDTAIRIAAKPPAGKPFAMQELAQQIMLMIVMRDVFGVTKPDEQVVLGKRIRELFEASSGALIFFPA